MDQLISLKCTSTLKGHLTRKVLDNKIMGYAIGPVSLESIRFYIYSLVTFCNVKLIVFY